MDSLESWIWVDVRCCVARWGVRTASRQRIFWYSTLLDCGVPGLRDPLLSSHRQSLHWILSDYQELWMARQFLKTWLKSCFLEPRWRWRLSAQRSWGELHLVFFRGFDARNYPPIWIPLQLSTFRAFKPFGSDILPFKDTKGEPTLEFQHALRVQQLLITWPVHCWYRYSMAEIPI
jgi:hypothetical protein